MDDKQLVKVNTLDRVEADLDEWEQALERARTAITWGETNEDEDGFRSARLEIKNVLDQIQNTRHFIEVKRNAVEDATADVETLFTPDQSAIQFEESIPLPDEE